VQGFRLSSPFAVLAAAGLGKGEGFKLIQVGGGQLPAEWDVFGDRLEALVLAPEGSPPSSDKRVRMGSYTPGELEPQTDAPGARTSDTRARGLGGEEPAAPLERWLLESKGWTAPREEQGLLAAVRATRFEDADFLILTDNAAGLSTLESLKPVLAQPNLQGVALRINLFGSHEPDANTLHAVDRLLREAGLRPFALSLAKYASAALPWPFMNAYPAEAWGGRPLLGYAIYLREAVGGAPATLLKAAAVRAMIDMPDQAAEILVTQSRALSGRLDVTQALDLLARAIQSETGQAPTPYADFIAAFEQGAPDFYGFNKRHHDWLVSLQTFRREGARRIADLEQQTRDLIDQLAQARDRDEAVAPPEVMLARIVNDVDARSRLDSNHHWIFDHYLPFRGAAAAHTQIDFIGTVTTSDLGAAVMEAGYQDFQSQLPLVDEEYFEWIDILQAVLEAGPLFTMLELGAGYGRWSARAAAAATQRGKHVRLGVAEAEPKHRVWLDQHLKRNGVSPEDFRIFESAVAGAHGEIAFTVGQDEGQAESWFGQAAMPVDLQNIDPIGDYYGTPVYHSQGWRLIRVPKAPLSELLAFYDYVDLADFDLQGAEYEAIEEAIAPLTQKVRRLHLGTHSEEIEEQLRQLLPRHGWVKLRDYSLHKTHETPFGRSDFVDGVQSWINPALLHRPADKG
jgi:FkbM family methyltransferase